MSVSNDCNTFSSTFNLSVFSILSINMVSLPSFSAKCQPNFILLSSSSDSFNFLQQISYESFFAIDAFCILLIISLSSGKISPSNLYITLSAETKSIQNFPLFFLSHIDSNNLLSLLYTI